MVNDTIPNKFLRRNEAMIEKISHTGLVVQDIERPVAFYRDLIGLTVIREKETIAPPTGDYTAIPNVHRKLVVLGKPSCDHLLELVYYINPPSLVESQFDIN